MIRVRIAAAEGSTPRDAGTEMVVTATGTDGTIGGGRLELTAIEHARDMLAHGVDHDEITFHLGPGTGQCCGGRVRLTLDRDAEAVPDSPLPQVLIFGAGHVGRALARVMASLPFDVALIDERADQLAQAAPGVTTRLSALPEADIRAARPGAAIVIVTHDHALDFLLVAEALRRADTAYVGLIGSASKRARFETLAREQGLDPAPLVCPIGAGFAADKRPEMIAVFTAAEIAARLTRVHA